MSEVNIQQISEIAGKFQDMSGNYGGMVVATEEQADMEPRLVSGEAPGALDYFLPDPDKPEHRVLREIAAQGAGIVWVRPNFDTLIGSAGRQFGLLKRGEDGGIFPAVITARSRPPEYGVGGELRAEGELHIAYLSSVTDRIDPLDIAAGAGDPLNAMLLRTAEVLHGPTIAAHAPGGRQIPGELGHRYGGLRDLADPAVIAAIQRREDPTDQMAVSEQGLAARITGTESADGTSEVPGIFDIVDARGNVRRIQYRTVTLRPDSTAIIIDHPNFSQDISGLLGGMPAEIAATGLAFVAKLSREQPVDPGRAVRKYGEQALGLVA